jgi:plasmid replication initiation protein
MYIDEWKDFFGVLDKYPKVFDFKRRVLEPAINVVNSQGEFTLTLKQEK